MEKERKTEHIVLRSLKGGSGKTDFSPAGIESGRKRAKPCAWAGFRLNAFLNFPLDRGEGELATAEERRKRGGRVKNFLSLVDQGGGRRRYTKEGSPLPSSIQGGRVFQRLASAKLKRILLRLN